MFIMMLLVCIRWREDTRWWMVPLLGVRSGMPTQSWGLAEL